MNKKKKIIILLFIFIIISISICLLFNLNKKKDRKIYEEVNEPSNFVVDVSNKENISIVDNIKTNNSEKVRNRVYAKALNEGLDNVIYMDNGSIKADIDNDTCVFEGNIYNNTGIDIKRLCISIVFYSNDDKIIGTVEYYVNDFKNNTSQNVKYDSEYDISNAYRYTLVYDIME